MSTPETSGERAACNGFDVSFRPKLVPLTEGVRQLGISRPTAYRLIASGKFPLNVIRVGSRWFVRTADIDALTSASP